MSNINNQGDTRRHAFYRNLRNFGACAGISAIICTLILSGFVFSQNGEISKLDTIISAIVQGQGDSKDEIDTAKRLIFEKDNGIFIQSISRLDGSAWNTEIVDALIKKLDPSRVKVLRNYRKVSVMPFAHLISYYTSEKDFVAEVMPVPQIMIVIPASYTVNAELVNNYNSLDLYQPETIKRFENLWKDLGIKVVSISQIADDGYQHGALSGIESCIVGREEWENAPPQIRIAEDPIIRGYYKGHLPELKEQNLTKFLDINSGTIMVAYKKQSSDEIFLMFFQRPWGLG
ncbi:MAG: hypothetical protein WC449_04275 [Candidatus Paceibacterota bacterium]